ncbi:hypothetical protein AVEN_115386-1 [Araneus ventricosus]|uniref:Paired domain-containing protein n=1 Tax=Araneus ventricosus TaxID=182803 RepID=A0A4Y1ZZC5_ARAVE|nr:hypothetical protein AVEN_115386-1 [Araneus ventricosus]
MEMGLTEADAAKRLNESGIVVQRLFHQFHFENSVPRRSVPGRLCITTPTEGRFLAVSARRRRNTTMLQLVSNNLIAAGKRI